LDFLFGVDSLIEVKVVLDGFDNIMLGLFIAKVVYNVVHVLIPFPVSSEISILSARFGIGYHICVQGPKIL
jgi:hypothetical protein